MPQQSSNQESSTSLKGSSRDGSSGGSGTNSSTLTNAGPGSDGQFWTSTQRLAKKYRTEVAASASSVLSTMSTFPLDSVKTRMQTYKYAGFVDCVKQTYHTEKLRGFFRGRLLRPSLNLVRGLAMPMSWLLPWTTLGVTAPMLSITAVRTTSFSIYQRSKYAYSDWVKRNFGFDVMGHVASNGSLPNFWTVATFGAAGATAGSCITLIACKSLSNSRSNSLRGALKSEC